VRLGREAGVPDATIEVIGSRGDLDALEGDEATVVRYVRALLGGGHRVPADVFQEALRRFGEQGVVDLTGLVGYYGVVAAVLNAFEVEPPSGAPPLPA